MISMVSLNTAHKCCFFSPSCQNVPMRLCESSHGRQKQHETQCKPEPTEDILTNIKCIDSKPGNRVKNKSPCMHKHSC